MCVGLWAGMTGHRLPVNFVIKAVIDSRKHFGVHEQNWGDCMF